MKKTLLLCIFDGLGLKNKEYGNAFLKSKNDFFLKLWKENYFYKAEASGSFVGLLPKIMGNSEVGHITLGSGRIIKQPLTEISEEINNRNFFKKNSVKKFITKIIQTSKRLHLIGIASSGQIHSWIEHLKIMCLEWGKLEIEIFLHLILDGRDTKQNAGLKEIGEFLLFLKNNKLLENIKIATTGGRYYAFDRDKRFERNFNHILAMLQKSENHFTNILEYIEKNYENQIFDEFIMPAFNSNCKNAVLKKNDFVCCFNFRQDRAIQISSILSNPNYCKSNIKIPKIYFASMRHYNSSVIGEVFYPIQKYKNTLGEILANNNLKQLRIAETEKAYHVTKFFDAGQEITYPLEDKIIVKSPQQFPTYDFVPEMSAKLITEKIVNNIGKYDIIIANFANCDMVGHTGNFLAVQKAIEFLNKSITLIHDKILNVKGNWIITADHGNCEKMLNDDGSICKTHTKSLVPLCFILSNKNDYKLINEDNYIVSLQDVAPSILTLLNIAIPKEIEGKSLLVKKYEK